MLTGVISDTTRLMGISESSFDAWGEVRGKPSRMNEASGEDEGKAGVASAREVLDGTQDFDFNSERMRRRIMSSGTREPDCMWDSASWPAVRMALEALSEPTELLTGRYVVRFKGNGAYPRASCCGQHCARGPQSSLRTTEGNVS